MIDIEQIKTDVSKIVSYSQDIEQPKVDWLIDNWYKAKSSFINMMGGKLIYECPKIIQLNLSKALKQKEFDGFVEAVDNLYHCQALTDFVIENEAGFFNNEVVKEYKVSEDITIPVGMKLLKAFKFFLDDKEDLYYIQNYGSSIIQKNKITGRLCISVHPLDFLSSSENNHNWRSCHALDGEYRAGNLSYMLDSTTLVCYLKSEGENVRLDNFGGVKWNDKKWRMLLFISKDRQVIFAGRQYPFQSECALDLVKENLLPNIGIRTNTFCNWRNTTVDEYLNRIHVVNDTYILIQDKLYDKYQIIKNGSNLHYNDLLSSTCYKPYYMYNNLLWYSSPQGMGDDPFIIGHKVKCLKCEEHYITDSEWMTCDRCHDSDSYFYCENCGKRFWFDEEDATYMPDGTILCEDCFDSIGAYCEHCDEAVYEDDLIYDGETELGYCHYCFDLYINGE